MDTLKFICEKFNVRLQPDSDHRRNYQSMPLEIGLNRNGLASLFNELGFKKGAEIGVEQGEYSEVLATANPNATLYLVDAWKAYRGYRDHVSQSKLDGFLESVKARMKPYQTSVREVHIIKSFSVDAAKEFENGSLDFVYLDGNHAYEYVVSDLASWVPKVRVGGIVSGHDWFTSNGPYHVPHAVNGYCRSYGIAPYFVCRGDHTASWFWVKTA